MRSLVEGRSVPTSSLLMLLSCLLFAQAAGAEQDTPLTLIDAERLALSEEPGALALEDRASAFEASAIAAGQLPDPKLRLGLANYPIQSGDFSSEAMTQAQLGLRQSFPAGRSLAVRNERFRHLAAEMDQQADARRRDVREAVRIAWLNVFFWTEAGNVVSESRPYFQDLVEVTRALYSVGRGDQQDLLRAELELSRLEDRLIEIRRQRASAQAALGEWVGAAAVRPLASELPEWDPLPDLDVMRASLAHHPLVEAASARVDAGGSGVELARQQYKPGWDLDVGYGYREGELPDGDSRPDFLSVSVTLDLPLFRRNRQDQMVKAAVSERSAAQASRDELLRRLAGDLEAEYAHFRELDHRVALYDERILTQAAGQAQAALSAYQSDAADFADVMRGYIDALDARLEREKLSVERAQSRARLANLGGLDHE